MARTLLALCVLAAPSLAFADAHPLTSLDDVHRACGEARDRPTPELLVIEVEDGWQVRETEEGLQIDGRRRLNAFEGHVSVMLTDFEPIAFEVPESAGDGFAQRLNQGGRLRLGFFLGYDDRRRQPCLVRNAHAVTIVRADVAFAEIFVDERRVARSEHDRLRAWNDDNETFAVPGQGPRGAVGDARFSNGADAPANWQTALEADAMRQQISQCHAEGMQRGAAGQGQVVVRLNVETRTGRVRRADVALSSVGDGAEAECIARALGSSASLPPGPSDWRAEVVDLAVPVRLAH